MTGSPEEYVLDIFSHMGKSRLFLMSLCNVQHYGDGLFGTHKEFLDFSHVRKRPLSLMFPSSAQQYELPEASLDRCYRGSVPS
mgnify:CR=1 FL=1